MSASTDLCSRTNLKSYLGLTGTGHDDTLDMLIDAASEAIESYCRRSFGVTAHVEYHDGGHDRIVLRHRPVTALTGLWDDLAREFSDSSEITSDDYVLDSDLGILHLDAGTFAEGIRNVKVSYSAGYSTIPDDLSQACILLAAAWFNQGRAGGDGLRAQTLAGVAHQFGQQPLPESVRQLLSSYRDHAV